MRIQSISEQPILQKREQGKQFLRVKSKEYKDIISHLEVSPAMSPSNQTCNHYASG